MRLRGGNTRNQGAGIKANSLMSLQLIMKAAAILKGANTVPFGQRAMWLLCILMLLMT